MRPRRGTLLRTIRTTVAMLAGQSDRPAMDALLNVIDVCANELMLREDPAFYLDYHRRGVELLQRGSALVAEGASPALSSEAPLEAGIHPDMLEQAVADISRRLEEIVRAIARSSTEEASALLRDIGDWELSLHLHRMSDAGYKAELPASILRNDLEAYLRKHRPEWPELRVTEFRMIPGGFSKFTYLFDTYDDLNGVQQLIARVEPPVRFLDLDGMDLRNEFPVVQFAFQAGLPVAEPLWFEDDKSKLGYPFIVSRRVHGEVYGTVKGTDRDVPDDVVRMLASALARIHTTPVDLNNPLLRQSHLAKWLSYSTLPENTLAFIEYWAKQLPMNQSDASPLLAEAIEWLRANVPQSAAPMRLLHGDLGLHNLMIHEGRLAAILDWENSRVGDPSEDFAHFFNGVGDRIDRARFIRLYEEAGGPKIDEYRLRYFKVYSCTNNSLACLATLARMDHDPRGNVSWSAYGLHFAYHYLSMLRDAMRDADLVKP